MKIYGIKRVLTARLSAVASYSGLSSPLPEVLFLRPIFARLGVLGRSSVGLLTVRPPVPVQFRSHYWYYIPALTLYSSVI
jgi:hypothetical protein